MDTNIKINQATENKNTNTYIRHINRADKYRKNISSNYFIVFEESRLSLRKEKLNDLIQQKRNFYLEESKNLEKSKLVGTSLLNNKLDNKELGQIKVIVSEDKSINDRFLNLSLNKKFDINQICQFLEKNLNELKRYSLKNIHLFNIREMKIAVFNLRSLFLKKDFIIQKSIQMELFVSLFTIIEINNSIQNYDIELIFECLWCITNLSAIGDSDEINDIVIKRGVFKTLEYYLHSKHHKIVEQTLWCYGNLIGGSIIIRDNFFNHKILIKVLEIINDIHTISPIIRIGMWLISQLAKGNPPPKYENLSYSLVTITSNLWSNDEEVVISSLKILTFLSFCNDKFCELIVSSNCMKKLIDYAYIKKDKFYISCFKILGNLLCLDNSAEAIINHGILKLLNNYLPFEDDIILKDVVWCINQLSINSAKIINLMLENEAFMKNLTELLFKNALNKKLKIDVLKIIMNFISYGDISTLEYFLNQNIFLSIKNILVNNEFDATLYFCCILILEKIISYESTNSNSNKSSILSNLVSHDFNSIFENIYYKHKNLVVNQQIEKLISICNNIECEQMRI